MPRAFSLPARRWWALAGMVASLAACGGGSSEPEEAIPLYAGTYFVVLDKVLDDCSTSLPVRVQGIQTVSQSGRNVTVVTDDVVLQGQVDPDDLGISATAQVQEDGALVTSALVYRATDRVGLFGAGFTLVADTSNVRCTVAYSGQAQLQ